MQKDYDKSFADLAAQYNEREATFQSEFEKNRDEKLAELKDLDDKKLILESQYEEERASYNEWKSQKSDEERDIQGRIDSLKSDLDSLKRKHNL